NNKMEYYLTYWTETTTRQNNLQCYVALNREYTVANYLSIVSDAKQTPAKVQIEQPKTGYRKGQTQANLAAQRGEALRSLQPGRLHTHTHTHTHTHIHTHPTRHTHL